MENMTSALWSYQEIIDELKQQLLDKSLELESVRGKANEDMKMHQEVEKQSLQLLKVAVQERDEAREQLHKLLNNLIIPSYTFPTTEFSVTQLSPNSPPMNAPIKTAHSSLTESNSLSEPYHNHSQNSSSVESYFDTVSSPELSNITNHIGDSSNKMGLLINQPFVQDYNGTIGYTKIDSYLLMTDTLVKGKNLPEKGKFLQSMHESGPLIQTLLVAGPLPRWRNPPPLQALYVPPLSAAKGSVMEIVEQSANGTNAESFVEMSRGSSQIVSNSGLSFGNGDSGTWLGNGSFSLYEGPKGDNFVPTAKRQKFN